MAIDWIGAGLSAMAAGAILVGMLSIATRRPALAGVFFFVFFAFAWRLGSALYIDLFGPFADQLYRDVGPGISAVPLALSQGAIIAAILFSFRRERLSRLFSKSGALGAPIPSDVPFLVASLFVAGLWFELVFRGPIPLFAGLERYEYAAQFGGPLHHLFLRWGPMLSFLLGFLLAAPVLRSKSPDWSFAALFAGLMIYLFFVGHRFSSLYSNTSFFIIPGSVVLLRRNMLPKRLRTLSIAGAIMAVLVLAAVVYSYAVVRGVQDTNVLEKLSQRALVQQGEMWWMTYERVFLNGDWNGLQAAFKLFVSPFDPHRNSTMQFLMESALPLDRAHFILRAGSAYTGGWPEVFFELGGPIGGFVLVCMAAIAYSEFMFLLARCIIQERYVTTFFLIPLLYAMSVLMVSGMVNSFIQTTFLIKVALAITAYFAESAWRSRLRTSSAHVDCPSR